MFFDRVPGPLLLPDFAASTSPTGDLRAHMRSFFYLSLSQSYVIQMETVTAIIGLLVILGGAVVVWRTCEGSIWIFRVQEASRSEYSLLIPNTTMVFVLIEAFFGIVFLVYIWCQLTAFRHGYDLADQGFWLLSTWWLLFTGAWFGSVGTFYASPGVLSRRHLPSGRFDVARLIPGPGVCNLICVGVPLLVVASTGVIAILVDRHWKAAFSQWKAFDEHLAKEDPLGPVASAATAAALQVWEEWTITWWYIRIGFFVWAGWATLLFCFYLPSGAQLALTLKQQFEESRKTERELKMTLQRRRKEREVKTKGEGGLASPNPPPQWKGPAEEAVVGVDGERRRRKVEAVDEARRAAQSTFYPPIRAERTEINSTAGGPPIDVLRKSLILIIVMWGSISSAVASYAALCVWASINTYKASTEGPLQLAETYMLYNLIAAWLACAFGGLNFIWITSRTFEPVLEGLQMNKSKNADAVKSITTFFSSSRPARFGEIGTFTTRNAARGSRRNDRGRTDRESQAIGVEELTIIEEVRTPECDPDTYGGSDDVARRIPAYPAPLRRQISSCSNMGHTGGFYHKASDRRDRSFRTAVLPGVARLRSSDENSSCEAHDSNNDDNITTHNTTTTTNNNNNMTPSSCSLGRQPLRAQNPSIHPAHKPSQSVSPAPAPGLTVPTIRYEAGGVSGVHREDEIDGMFTAI